MRIKLGNWKLIAILSSIFALNTRADMNGYVAPGFIYNYHLSDSEKGSRMGAHIEFARLTSFVAADLKAMTGGNYKDYGGILKFYYPWDVSPSWTLQFGGGAGASWSSGYGDSITEFYDVIVQPFVGALWKYNDNFGVLINTGVEIVPYRKVIDQEMDSTRRYRFIFSLSVAIGA